ITRPRARRWTAVRLELSKLSCVTLTAQRRGGAVATVVRVFPRGRWKLAWRPPRPGRYTIALDAQDLAGHHTRVARTVSVRRAQPERVAHRRPLAEAAEHGALEGDAGRVEEGLEALQRREERLGVRIADARDDVPVAPARRQRERPSRGVADQPPVGVQQVEQS